MPRLLRLALFGAASAAGLLAGPAPAAAPAEQPGWTNLFDGRTLDGWKAAEHPESWTVKDGTLACHGERSHLFYVGPVQAAQFGDFEAEVEVLTQPGANSGVYFHTAWQDAGWPSAGFEMQVNNTQPPFAGDSGGAYREHKKTGSLYGIRNTYKALARDGDWFTLRLRVEVPRVRIHVNDVLVVDYVEPRGGVPGLTPPLNRLGKGTFALQCHDARSPVQYRRVAVRPLPAPAAGHVTRAAAPDAAAARRYRLARDNFPLVDLRAVDASRPATLEPALAAARAGALFVGVTAAAGANGRLDDAGVQALARRFGNRPLFLGLSAGGPGWDARLTPAALAAVDFVLLDGRTLAGAVPLGSGPQAYADALVAGTVSALGREAVDVYGAPLALPAALAAQRDAIWTDARLQQVIDAAVRAGVALEINGRLQLPGAAFVQKAKAAGARFTLGECAVGTPAGDWCFALVEQAGLDWRHMYVPGHAPPRAARAR
jgi:hypothetical protein